MNASVNSIVSSKLEYDIKYSDLPSVIAMFKTCLARLWLVSSKIGLANFFIASWVAALNFVSRKSTSDLSTKIISSSVKPSVFLKKSVVTFRVGSFVLSAISMT